MEDDMKIRRRQGRMIKAGKSKRRLFKWNPLKTHRRDLVVQVVNELEEYWPLTIRQIHYQLFSRQVDWGSQCGARRPNPYYPNTQTGQQDLIQVAKFARIDGYIPWDCIEDRTRTMYRPYKFEDIESYLKNELHYMLTDFKRCLVQDQDVYIELWIEKDALFRLFKKICEPYCVRLVACKGYDSVTFLREFTISARKAIELGQTPTVLYFGDLDPSGLDIINACIETLKSERELNLDGFVFKRIAVTKKQVEELNLCKHENSGKISDKRYPEYIKEYGNIFVELDAIPPRDLERITVDAIENEFDMDSFNVQGELEQQDQIRIEHIKSRIVDVFNEELGTHFSV